MVINQKRQINRNQNHQKTAVKLATLAEIRFMIMGAVGLNAHTIILKLLLTSLIQRQKSVLFIINRGDYMEQAPLSTLEIWLICLLVSFIVSSRR